MALQIIVKNSSVSGNEPTAGQLANGELALNYHANGPFITCKDTAGVVRRVTGVWVNATAPSSPTPGELWLDISVTPAQLKVYKDSGDTWVAAITVYAATTSIAGVIELATDAETQTGSETNRAVTPASLQSKLSDSTSTTSNTTIASSTAVKAAYDLANAALPKTGGTVTGNLEIGTAGSLSFEGATADGFETTIAVVDPTADRTITLPNTTGTVVTTGDSGTVTSTMLLDGTIVNADINASAAIVDTKLATIATAGKVSNSATTAASANTASAIVARDASGNFSAGTITAALTGAASSNVLKAGDTMTGALVVPLASAATPSLTFTGDLNTGIYSPGADTLAFVEGGAEAMRIDSSGRLLVGTTSSTGLLSNTAPVIAGLFKSFNNAADFTTGVAQTLFTIPNTDATYIITLRRGSVGDATNYEAVSILSANATVGGSVSTVLTALKTAGNVSISISGTDLKGTQTSGGAASLQWFVTRVG